MPFRVPCLVTVLALVPAGTTAGPVPSPNAGDQVRKKTDPPGGGGVDYYGGQVTRLTAKSITIDKGPFWEERVPCDASGRPQPQLGTKTWYPAPPPRTLLFHPALAEGKLLTRCHDQYRPLDVRVGDHVEVRSVMMNGEWTCVGITIGYRPGGRVPPSPNMVHWPNSPTRPHHERMNAYADLHERGIPLPEWMTPEWERQRVLVAPPPREVEPTPIPAASP
jgi:hypothetical protein